MPCFTEIISDTRKEVSSRLLSSIKYVWEEHKTALFTVVAVASVMKIHQAIKNKKRREKWNSTGKDIVVLHEFGRGKTCPNVSPYALKLETYLRMADINYEIDTEQIMGPKGKTPWITLNGEDQGDSELIMNFLGEKFGKDFSSHLSFEQKAAARSMAIMTDEHLFWGLVWWRIVKDPGTKILKLMNFPCNFYMLLKYHKNIFRQYLHAQGLGRHTDAEVEGIIREDLKALSLYLGDKPFLMGNKPCEVDCSVFGMVSQFVWCTPGAPFETMVENEYKNLLQYCIRMKEQFWPDWEECLDKSGE